MNTSNALLALLGIPPDGHEYKVMRLLVELGVQSVAADEGSLLVLDKAKGELTFAMTVGSSSSEQRLLGQSVPIGQGLVGQAALTHEVQIGSPMYHGIWLTGSTEEGNEPKAVIAAPMLIEDELIGVITAVRLHDRGQFSLADALIYGRIAAVAGVVVDQRRRLAAIQAGPAAMISTMPVTDRERAEQTIMEVISRVVRLAPEKLPALARLLQGAADFLL